MAPTPYGSNPYWPPSHGRVGRDSSSEVSIAQGARSGSRERKHVDTSPVRSSTVLSVDGGSDFESDYSETEASSSREPGSEDINGSEFFLARSSHPSVLNAGEPSFGKWD